MSQRLHPRENPQLLGHEDAEREILDAWKSSRTHHAWLISGPKGIGKATLAYRFARFVLSGVGNAPDPDNTELFGLTETTGVPASLEVDKEHPVFRRVAGNSHADLQVIERGLSDDGKRMQTVIPVDKIRAIGKTMSLTAGEGGWRVIIVDGADEMNPNAANALLKVLEEPPPRALLLLVTHLPGRLLPTIRSRCCQLRLSSLKRESVDKLLADTCPELSVVDRKALIRLSDGSIGRALDLADSEGINLQQELIALMNSLPRLDMVLAHKFANKVARRDAEAIWKNAVDLASRNLADIVTAGARGMNLEDRGYGPKEAACLSRLQSLGTPDRWVHAWEKNSSLFISADTANLDRKQVMLDALSTMENATRTGV
jgi:DNA polymerase-3 subunit delta'